MTSEQRKDLLNLCEMLGDPYASMSEHDDADSIRAALAEIDAQAEELALLRRVATKLTCSCQFSDCTNAGCMAYREWHAKYGGAQ